MDDRPCAKMTPDGSVFLVIRPHVRDGVLSDYLLQTRLAVREAGWHECEELIWLKPDAPPLGSLKRPRRTWESVLWFSRSPQPYCDLKACGKESERVGFEGSFGSAWVVTVRWTVVVQAAGCTNGVARISDVIVANVGGNEPGLESPSGLPAGSCRATGQDVQPGGRSGLGPLLRERADFAGGERMRASLSGDRAGGEIRQDCPGAVADDE